MTTTASSIDTEFESQPDCAASVTPTVAAEQIAGLRDAGHSTLWMSLGSLLGQGFQSGSGFVTGVLVARYCSAGDLDVYHLALSILLVLRGVQAELVTAPFSVFRPRVPANERSAYAGSIFIHQALATVICGVAFVSAVSASHWWGWRVDLGSLLSIACLIPVALLTRDFVRYFSYAAKRFDAALVLDAVCGTVQIGVLVVIWQTIGLTPIRVYSALVGASLLGIVAWYVTSRPRVTVKRARVWNDFRTNWTFSRWALSSQLLCACAPYFITWLTAGMCPPGSAGRMQSCSQLVGVLYLFTVAISNVLTPKASQVFVEV